MIYSIISLLLAVLPLFYYISEIIKLRAKPARATTIMFFILMCIIALTQKSTSNNNVIILTYGLIFNQGLLVLFALKYGVGGLRKIDIVCYCLFFLTVVMFLLSNAPKLVLCLSILTDFVAFIPVILKNWHDPKSDSIVYFSIEGMLAPIFSMLSSSSFDLISLAFPLYLLIVNFVALLPLVFRARRKLSTVKE